jgi:FkbM family methyltransferase
MKLLKESREKQSRFYLSLLPVKLQCYFNRMKVSVSSRRSFRQYLLRGDFDYLEMFVNRQKVSIDVGTSNGQYALKLSAISRACLCIEPLQEFKAIGAILPGNCIFKSVAAGNHTGWSTLRIPLINDTPDYGQSTLSPENLLDGHQYIERQTEVCTIDQLVSEVFPDDPVGFIKIDVEGFEDAVLEGAVLTLKNHRPNLQVELHGNLKIKRVCDFLSTFGYRGLFFFENRIYDSSHFDAGIHRAPENEYNFLARQGLSFNPSKYICDFYFIPATSALVSG